MLKFNFILLVLFISSCANTSEFKTVLLPNDKMNWRFCSYIDGEFNQKGFCFITKKCRDKFIGKQCEKETLFCGWGELECYNKYSLQDKKIITKY